MGFTSFKQGESLLPTEDMAWNQGFRSLMCKVDCEELLVTLDDNVCSFWWLQKIKELFGNDWFVSILRQKIHHFQKL